MSYELLFSPRSTAGSESHALPIPATRSDTFTQRETGDRNGCFGNDSFQVTGRVVSLSGASPSAFSRRHPGAMDIGQNRDQHLKFSLASLSRKGCPALLTEPFLGIVIHLHVKLGLRLQTGLMPKVKEYEEKQDRKDHHRPSSRIIFTGAVKNTWCGGTSTNAQKKRSDHQEAKNWIRSIRGGRRQGIGQPTGGSSDSVIYPASR